MAMRTQQMVAERKMMEATTELVANYVDPEDRYCVNGEWWGGVCNNNGGESSAIDTQEQLDAIRCKTRQLADTNEFAIGGQENRVNYIVGTGHTYQATAKPNTDVSEQTLANVQVVVDEFLKANNWSVRQREIQWRKDRDGECFLRFFVDSETNAIRVRFVEPGQVSTPSGDQRDNATFGIVTDEDDVETVVGYYVDDEQVDADDIQHRKANVDLNVKRGLPLYYPVTANLSRIEKLLRNMTTVAGIQAAVAMIRKHSGAGADSNTTADFVANHADVSVTPSSTSSTAKTQYYERFRSGTILDAPSSMDYEFPANAIDASRYVQVIQAELRAIAARLVMPEFMLTSDASNANYSSTLVAEGPAVKNFQRLQQAMADDDIEILDRVLDRAVDSEQITQEERDSIDIDVTTPTVISRDRLDETKADQILVAENAMSIHTFQLRNELDPEHETERIEAETETKMQRMDAFGGFGGTSDNGEDNEGQQPSGQESGDGDGED
jgi:capsid protein